VTPDDRGILRHGFGGNQTIKTSHQGVLQGRRNRKWRERPCEFVVPIDLLKVTRFKNRFGQLLDKEWDPVCLRNDLLEHCWREGFSLGHACDNLFHLAVRETVQRHFGEIRPVMPGRVKMRTTGQYRQHGGRRYLLDDQIQQFQRRWVCPV
jgi:hypothetical protein